MKTYPNTIYVLAIRQILLQKAVGQVVLEQGGSSEDAGVPRMMHYDGSWLPVEAVTIPEAVPEEQRNDDWSRRLMKESVCLSCEHDGYLYADLFDGSKDEADFEGIFKAVYGRLADKDTDPETDDWLENFGNAIENGVPQFARALRGRLLENGFTEGNPFRPEKEVTLKEIIDIPYECTTRITRRTTNRLWPCENTVAFRDGNSGRAMLVRNYVNNQSGVSLTWLDDGILEIKSLDDGPAGAWALPQDDIRRTVREFADSTGPAVSGISVNTPFRRGQQLQEGTRGKYFAILVSWNRMGETTRNEVFNRILYRSRKDAWARIAEEIAFMKSNGDDLVAEDTVMTPAPVPDWKNCNHDHGALMFRPEDIEGTNTFTAHGKGGEEYPELSDRYLKFEITELETEPLPETMTFKDLKERISPSLVQGIANILNDPTIDHKKEQIQWMIFNQITDRYWDETDDDQTVFTPGPSVR